MHQFIIFDTEFLTTEPKSYLLDASELPDTYSKSPLKEIIQIGAVRVGLAHHVCYELRSFSVLIQPIKTKKLSDFYTTRTGITDEHLAQHGTDFSVALNHFFAFCYSCDLPIYSWGQGFKLLKDNCYLHHYPMPTFPQPFKDIRKIFEHQGICTSGITSSEISLQFGENVQGIDNDALHDARSVLNALQIITHNHIDLLFES